MNILAGILFIVAAIVFLIGLANIGDVGILVLHIIRALIGFAALLIAYLISAQSWICIVGTISVSTQIIITILSIINAETMVDLDSLQIPLFIAGFLAVFANMAIGIALFF